MVGGGGGWFRRTGLRGRSWVGTGRTLEGGSETGVGSAESTLSLSLLLYSGFLKVSEMKL